MAAGGLGFIPGAAHRWRPHDVAILMSVLTDHAFSIMSWDSTGHTDMPLTVYASAVQAYMDSSTAAVQLPSQGSQCGEPARAKNWLP